MTPFDLLETGAPWWRIAMAGDVCWRVHASGEFYDTANAAPSLSLAGTFVSVNADFATGAVLAGQLPKAIKATRKRGDVDVSATTTWTLSDSAITTAIDANGLLEISAVAGTGYVDVISNRDGVELRQRVTVQKVLGQPPSAGGGGATTATDTSIGNVTSASYGTVHGGPLTVRAGAAGTVALTAPLSFSATPAGGVGTFGLRGKWQWRIVGGSWADVATEITESSPDEVYDEGGGFYYSLGTGAIEVNQTKTGLTNGTDYEFQLLLRTPSGTRTRSVFDGTATAVAS